MHGVYVPCTKHHEHKTCVVTGMSLFLTSLAIWAARAWSCRSRGKGAASLGGVLLGQGRIDRTYYFSPQWPFVLGKIPFLFPSTAAAISSSSSSSSSWLSRSCRPARAAAAACPTERRARARQHSSSGGSNGGVRRSIETHTPGRGEEEGDRR